MILLLTVVIMIVFMSAEVEKLMDADSCWCSNTFSSLLQDPSTHDVTFKTSDGGSVSAHRVIVAAGSPVFHAMLYGNMKESNQKEIELPNIDSSTLKDMFHFIYTGQVQGSIIMCLNLLPAADYFGVGALKAVCFRMVQDRLEFDIYQDVATFAIEHHLDSVFEACVEFMECNVYEICRFNSGKPIPLPLLVAFLTSSDIEASELFLFLTVVDLCEMQKDVLSADDIKQIFQHIRYPLIQKNDLIEKVHPTNMADPDLYKAALEYHDTDKFDGPQEQIEVRKFYFDFIDGVGLDIMHTAKGTMIRKSTAWHFTTTATAYVSIQELVPIPFIFCLKFCANKRKTSISIRYQDSPDMDRVSVEKIPIGEEIHGLICLNDRDGYVNVVIGEALLRIPEYEDDYCSLSITLGSVGDQICIFRV